MSDAHLCMSLCVCLGAQAQCSRLAWALCQQGAGVGRQPWVARCPSVWPSVCRLRPLCAKARQSQGARGWGCKRGLKGISTMGERGRQGVEGWRVCGCLGGSWLAAHLTPPPHTHTFLLSFICTHTDELWCTGRETEAPRQTSLYASQSKAFHSRCTNIVGYDANS